MNHNNKPTPIKNQIVLSINILKFFNFYKLSFGNLINFEDAQQNQLES